MRSDLSRGRMDKIEFQEDADDPAKTGWYINSYDDLSKPPVTSVGPYETKTHAFRMWGEKHTYERTTE